jgi:hypothetical protein
MRKVSISLPNDLYFRVLFEAGRRLQGGEQSSASAVVADLIEQHLPVPDCGMGERLDTPPELGEGERRATREEVELLHGEAVAEAWERAK